MKTSMTDEFFVQLGRSNVPCDCSGLVGCPKSVHAKLRSEDEFQELLKDYPHLVVVRDSRKKQG